MTSLHLMLALVVAVQCVHAQDECYFPDYMSRHELWLNDVTMQGALTGRYFSVKDNEMEITSYTSTGEHKSTYECMHSEGDKVATRIGQGSLVGYQCFQFIKRSGTVVQLKMSVVSLELSDDICSDDNLIRHAAPLVAPYVENEDDFVACSLHGGYDMDVYDSDGGIWCKNDDLKPRWESNCQAGEGTKVEFRNYDCKARLDMLLIQQLFCLATWAEAGYVFSVVINNDYERPRLWMMRHTVGAEDEGLQRAKFEENPQERYNFDVLFFSELVADIESSVTTKAYVRLHMIQVLYPTLCENEAISCPTCDANTEYYCQKECHKCDHLRMVRRCQFTGETRGEWLQMRLEGTTNVRVGETMMYVDDLLPLQCMGIHTEEWFEGSGRKALYTVYGNGCRPRYNCVQMNSISLNVMKYRLGQGIIWPYTEKLTPQDVCRDDVFQDDPPPLNDKYHNSRTKFLIKSIGTTDSYQSRVPVSCGLHGKWDLNATSRVTGESCRAQIDACSNDSTSFSFSLWCQEGSAKQYFTCLGSATSSNQVETFILAQDRYDPNMVFCWMLHQSDWQVRPTLILTQPSDCYSGLAVQILYAGSLDYWARMEFIKEYPYGLSASSSSCDDPQTSTPEATATTTILFWGPSPTTTNVPPSSPSFSVESTDETDTHEMQTSTIPVSTTEIWSTGLDQSSTTTKKDATTTKGYTETTKYQETSTKPARQKTTESSPTGSSTVHMPDLDERTGGAPPIQINGILLWSCSATFLTFWKLWRI